MKVNSKNFKGIPYYPLEHLVYSSTENSQNKFIYNNELVVAHREVIELTQDTLYKTQFYNEKLSKAIFPKTKSTLIRILDQDKNEINNIYNFFKLDREHSSLVFNIEPTRIPYYCSVVIYDLATSEDLLFRDGSNTMSSDYEPVEDKHVVTKDYLLHKINELKAGLYTLDNFYVLQNNQPLVEGICYKNNQTLPIIFIYNTEDVINLSTKSFIIENNFKEDVEIYINIHGQKLYKEKISNILEGTSIFWKLDSSRNIFSEKLSNIYWLNSYKLDIQPVVLEKNLVVYKEDPFLDIEIVIQDSTGKSYKYSKQFGIDKYIKEYNNEISINYDELNLLNYKKKYVSGIAYLENKNTNYELPVIWKFKNSNLYFYRPTTVAVLGTIENNQDKDQVNLELSSHLPSSIETEYSDINKLKINIYTTALYIKLYNVKNELLYKQILNIDCSYSDDEETYRVHTPSSDTEYPEVNELTDWDSKKSTEIWDPILRKGYYLSDEDNCALCFRIDPSDHYSHIVLDIEHEGKIYIKSDNNTGWLDCSNFVNPFKNPTSNKDGCKLGENNIYTFGKVVYQSPVYIRIINSKKTKINKMELI